MDENTDADADDAGELPPTVRSAADRNGRPGCPYCGVAHTHGSPCTFPGRADLHGRPPRMAADAHGETPEAEQQRRLAGVGEAARRWLRLRSQRETVAEALAAADRLLRQAAGDLHTILRDAGVSYPLLVGAVVVDWDDALERITATEPFRVA